MARALTLPSSRPSQAGRPPAQVSCVSLGPQALGEPRGRGRLQDKAASECSLAAPGGSLLRDWLRASEGRPGRGGVTPAAGQHSPTLEVRAWPHCVLTCLGRGGPTLFPLPPPPSEAHRENFTQQRLRVQALPSDLTHPASLKTSRAHRDHLGLGCTPSLGQS